MTEAFKIEKNVPMPGEPAKNRYPWMEMDVGDSFFIPCTKDGTPSIASVCRAAYAASYNHRRKYRPRTVDGGVRIWRVE